MQHAPHGVITLNKTSDPCRETERGSLLQSTADMKNNASLTNWNWNSPQTYYEDLQEFTRPWPVSAGWGADRKTQRSSSLAFCFVFWRPAPQEETKQRHTGRDGYYKWASRGQQQQQQLASSEIWSQRTSTSKPTPVARNNLTYTCALGRWPEVTVACQALPTSTFPRRLAITLYCPTADAQRHNWLLWGS